MIEDPRRIHKSKLAAVEEHMVNAIMAMFTKFNAPPAVAITVSVNLLTNVMVCIAEIKDDPEAMRQIKSIAGHLSEMFADVAAAETPEQMAKAVAIGFDATVKPS